MITTHKCYYPLYENKDKFIILITGGRGCETPTQEIIMADMTIKQIKDVEVGDKVMGEDGTPRNVLEVHRGRDMMFRIKQSNADDYVVTKDHILALQKSACADKGRLLRNGSCQFKRGRYPKYGDNINMALYDYIEKSKRFQYNFRGYKCGALPYKETTLPIPPYLLGVWLGDGACTQPWITCPDDEIVQYLQTYCDRNEQRLNKVWKRGVWHMSITSLHEEEKINYFLNFLAEHNLLENKHIPKSFVSNSIKNRLELLAGLIDSDGHYDGRNYEITQKNETLARQIWFVANTLGFRTRMKAKRCFVGDKDCGVSWRITISGDLQRIPCKVERKQAKRGNRYVPRAFNVSVLQMTQEGYGEYVGIVLDGDNRYVHSDGTVTHNSGKSYGTGAFIERLTFEKHNTEEGIKVHNVLYTRYTMVSASISVLPEFLEKINLDGTNQFFHATKADIQNTLTGSKIMFRGIRTSSGNQTAKLKSIHGITTFVVDEAEEWTSEQEFETIMYSIRQKGIQNRIIIIMNPTDSNHFIYQKYIRHTYKLVDYDGVPVQISTHPNVLHIHTSYLDNIQHLSPQFIAEAQAMKENNPERYAHIFMGRWTDVAEGAIFKKWGVIDAFPTICRKVAVGVDWGYEHDPTALIRCGIVDNRLYLDEVCYKTHLLIGDLIKEMRQDDIKDLQFYADSADPRLIQEIANGGVLIYPVAKGAGSIVAGIEKMKDMTIYVTKRSLNLQEELRNYTWDKDKDGRYINKPIDTYNHGIDAARYYVLGHLLGQVMAPKNYSRAQIGIF